MLGGIPLLAAAQTCGCRLMQGRPARLLFICVWSETTPFAGEHTSIANEVFLDGAVETGERAASQVLKRVGLGST
jgi:hypothetical protein